MKRIVHIFLYFLLAAAVFGLLLASFAMIWTMDVWRHITFDEIIYHLSAPIEGTNPSVIRSFVLRNLIPAAVVGLGLWGLNIVNILKRIKKAKLVKQINAIAAIVSVAVIVVVAALFINKYDAIGYYKAMNENSDFVKDNYVKPTDVDIQFPEKKRNVVYIFLESMEMSYADKSVGGAFDENYIPELTDLALGDNAECFAGNDETLNGAVPMHGATFTSGAMVAQTSGLPAMEEIGNAAGTQSSFYPGATTIGDILGAQGYNQELMVGSDAVFGGRAQYFSGHGGYKIFDYNYALNNGYIPAGYKVWWGYEDQKLFQFAKSEILALADEDQPFNFTMLTVDTHFEDGYVCPLCRDECGDNQYGNVMHCSSRQVTEFVAWLQQQDFYDNTTIVICGDHTTMDSNFCSSVDDGFLRRTYMTILNSAATCDSTEQRLYSTFDMFPTTLAAMGCQIEGDRLGLGVNLYSGQKTLLEQYGIQYVNTELSKNSDFIKNDIAGYKSFDEAVFETNAVLDTKYTPVVDDGKFTGVEFSLSGLETTDEPIQAIQLDVSTPGGTWSTSSQMQRNEDLSYSTVFSVDGLTDRQLLNLTVTVTDSNGDQYEIYKDTGYLGNIFHYLHYDINEYIDSVMNLDNVVVFAAACDDCSGAISDSTLELLREHGLEAKFDESEGLSWYGVVANGHAEHEDCSDSLLNYGGSLPNGDFFSLESLGSAGVAAQIAAQTESVRENESIGNESNSLVNGVVDTFPQVAAVTNDVLDGDVPKPMSSIVVNGKEYSPSNRGLLFVVYDLNEGCVIDAASFDTARDSFTGEQSKGTLDYEISSFMGSSRLSVSVSDIASLINLNNTGTADLYIWDASTIDTPKHYALSLENGSNGYTYTKSVDIDDLDLSTAHMSIYIKKAGGRILLRYNVPITSTQN